MQRIVVGVMMLFCCLGTVAAAAEKHSGTIDLAALKILDLQTAQTIALASNPDMAAAQARVEQARARVRQAAATWWPSLDLNGGGARQRLSESSYRASSNLYSKFGLSTDQTTEQYSANLQATWVLFDGFLSQFQGTTGSLRRTVRQRCPGRQPAIAGHLGGRGFFSTRSWPRPTST
jgi:Outer membrane protein